MSEQNPVTGPPYGGRDDQPEGAAPPGERPVEGEEAVVSPPASRGDDGEQSSRAPTEGAMSTGQTGAGPGAQGAEAPSPGDPDAGFSSLG
jgi:hypothetical protein